MTMRVLVTGADGVIGRALVPVLATHGHETHTSGRRASSASRHHVADLSVPRCAHDLIDRLAPDAIAHLAGGPAADRHELYRANVLTTIAVAQAAAALGTRPHLLVVGSAAEYGDNAGIPLTEAAALRPVSEYGGAKVAASTLAESLAGPGDFSLTIARPFNVVSADQPATTALGNLRAQLLQGEHRRRLIRCGRLDVIRDFVPLDFVAQSLARLIGGTHEGTYNICSGIGISVHSILLAMAAHLGVEVALEPQPDLLALPGADTVIGDPSRLAALGLSCAPTAESMAQLCLAT
ncbi:MAG: NAD-dependent epimerase/dehydratase family protein [Sporichthyaceae bacterium]